MSDEKSTRSKKYESTRKAFDDLGIEEKAFFLLESAVKAVADGLKKAGEQVSEAMKEASACADEESSSKSTNSSGSEDSEKQNQPKKKKTAKKTRAKKSASKKKSADDS